MCPIDHPTQPSSLIFMMIDSPGRSMGWDGIDLSIMANSHKKYAYLNFSKSRTGQDHYNSFNRLVAAANEALPATIFNSISFSELRVTRRRGRISGCCGHRRWSVPSWPRPNGRSADHRGDVVDIQGTGSINGFYLDRLWSIQGSWGETAVALVDIVAWWLSGGMQLR